MNAVKVFALGGLGEVGKNMYCVEYQDEIVVMDCGILFPDDNLLGIDYVINDYAYLVENKHKIVGLFITHGHEDHIGGIPFMYRELNVPLYASGLAVGLIKSKLKEHRGLNVTVTEFTESDVFKFKNLSVDFFRTNHSIPDSYGIVVRTPFGAVVNTGDFKFDLTPVGPHCDYLKMAALGAEGVLCLLSDSTNAGVGKFTQSETVIGNNIREIFRDVPGRVIVATFASNVHRVHQIIEASVQNKRKIAVFGRSMEKNIEVGLKMGYIKASKSSFVEGNEINRIAPENLTIICTGSQGEPMAALSRIANNTHSQITINPGDTVVFSSSPIPGNAESVGTTINKLFRNGAHVIVNSSLTDTHASGHGGNDELRLMLNLMKPKYFMPVHGEHRMLKNHAKIAESVGVPLENSFVMDNGDVLTIDVTGARKEGKVKAGDVYIDGSGIGDIGGVVIGDRKKLSEEGLLSVVMSIDTNKKAIVSRPSIISRGFIYMKENTQITSQIQKIAETVVNDHLTKEKIDVNIIKSHLNAELSSFIYKKTERRPMLLPIIFEI